MQGIIKSKKSYMDYIDYLHKEPPPVFSRKYIYQQLARMLSSGTLANLDSAGNGSPRVSIGNKVGYERDCFLEWLVNRIR